MMEDNEETNDYYRQAEAVSWQERALGAAQTFPFRFLAKAVAGKCWLIGGNSYATSETLVLEIAGRHGRARSGCPDPALVHSKLAGTGTRRSVPIEILRNWAECRPQFCAGTCEECEGRGCLDCHGGSWVERVFAEDCFAWVLLNKVALDRWLVCHVLDQLPDPPSGESVIVCCSDEYHTLFSTSAWRLSVAGILINDDTRRYLSPERALFNL